VLIERNSTREARTTDYVDASVFKASTLDADLLQCFYVAQEAFDVADLSIGVTSAGDAWDATSDKIENLLGGTISGDAVEYDQVVNLIGSAGGVPANVVAGNLLSSTATIPEWSGAGTQEEFFLILDDGDALVGPVLTLQRTNAAGASGDNDILGALSFDGEDDAAAEVNYARIHAKAIDVSAGDEEAELSLQVMSAGALPGSAKVTLDGITMGAAVVTGTLTQGGATVNDDITQNAALIAADAWTGSQASTFVALSDAATVLVDFNTEQNMYVTLTTSRTIGPPSNQTIGQSGYNILEQNKNGG